MFAHRTRLHRDGGISRGGSGSGQVVRFKRRRDSGDVFTAKPRFPMLHSATGVREDQIIRNDTEAHLLLIWNGFQNAHLCYH